MQNDLWLEHNKTQDSVVVTSTGLQYKIIADPMADLGEATPNNTSTVVCDYSLTLINGNVIDKGNSIGFYMGSVVPGFAEGCRKIHNQGDIEIYVPAYLGYDYEKKNSGNYSKAEGTGTEGTTGYIPPYSTLIFKVHICGISGN